jgi:hypothetical protein
LKRRGGFTRNELSVFAWDLQAWKIEKGFRYSRTRRLKPAKAHLDNLQALERWIFRENA